VVEHVDRVVGGEGAALAELRVGEEEHEVLPLVADVVELEAEGGAKPVEEVGAEGVPGAGERRRRGGCGGGSSLRAAAKTGKASAPSVSDKCGLRNQSHYWEEEQYMGIWGKDCEIAVTRCGADEVGIM
jgi:hypothetical protein